MNEPVIERNISQFREGSLKRNLGSPNSSQNHETRDFLGNLPIKTGFPAGLGPAAGNDSLAASFTSSTDLSAIGGSAGESLTDLH